ncbi:universal stress protein [Magnetovibrio sp. PR-2]|uniref:universal stress protein n=1 Tax=Magnetovibrio sp. PR-2 TaxID=3120356 RepID=UPI002FCDF31C
MRTILVPVDGASDNEGLLNTSFEIARTFGAHVEVLHVRADPRDAVPLFGEGMSGDMIEEMVEAADKNALVRANELERLFVRLYSARDYTHTTMPLDQGNAPTVEWRETIGREDEVVAARGRLADMIVTMRPDENASPMRALTLQTALFECGRPVLVLPPKAIIQDIGSHIAIAWNGTPQATRAVQGAMGFLANAEKVSVLTCGTDRTEPDGALELQGYLAWHGVSSSVVDCGTDHNDVGQALMEGCADIGADILVCGAYSHSRLLQTVMGGVTSSLMEQAGLPVLFSH